MNSEVWKVLETKLTGELCYQAKRSNITESLNTKIGAKSPRWGGGIKVRG